MGSVPPVIFCKYDHKCSIESNDFENDSKISLERKYYTSFDPSA